MIWIVAGVVVVIAGVITAYYKLTEQCEDCGRRTADEVDGHPVCANCAFDRRVKAKAAAEDKVMCPHGHGPMKKVISEEVILDQCDQCKGFWLEGSEFESLKQRFLSDGRSQGQASGQAAGMAVGMAMSNAMHSS